MKVFIDTNVFVFGLLFQKTNSKTILDLAESKEFEVIVSELVLDEIKRFFYENYGEQEAYNAMKYIETLSIIVPRENIKNEIKMYSGKIAEKDLENLGTAKHERVDFLLSYDRDYKHVKEYITPKEFVKKLKLNAFETEY